VAACAAVARELSNDTPNSSSFGASGLSWGRIGEGKIVEELWKYLVNAAPGISCQVNGKAKGKTLDSGTSKKSAGFFIRNFCKIGATHPCRRRKAGAKALVEGISGARTSRRADEARPPKVDDVLARPNNGEGGATRDQNDLLKTFSGHFAKS
jgi:hypothetical protein